MAFCFYIQKTNSSKHPRLLRHNIISLTIYWNIIYHSYRVIGKVKECAKAVNYHIYYCFYTLISILNQLVANMKKVIALCLLLGIFRNGMCQTEKIDNGFNFEDLCKAPSCKYFKFENDILFPQNEGTDWVLTNVEVAFKKSGTYLLTGDMDVKGDEVGVIFQLEVEFFNKSDQIIHVEQTVFIEHYSEPNYAEPMVIRGSIPNEIASQVEYLSFLVIESENVPYYELTTDCYGPCNNFQLSSSMKAFRKLK